jgi:cell cycle checkpoint protein
MPMALSTQVASEDEQFVLIAKIDSARNVSNILKAIHFKEVHTKFENEIF